VPTSEQWIHLPSRGPHPGPRLGHSLSLFGEQGCSVLLWGGCTETYEYCNAGYCFDGRNQTWTVASPVGTAPCPRSFHSGAIINNTLWVSVTLATHFPCLTLTALQLRRLGWLSHVYGHVACHHKGGLCGACRPC